MKPLNPIMAVLAIASVGVSPLRAFANDGKAAAALVAAGGDAKVKVDVPAGVPIATEASNSLTKLTDILAKNTAAKAEAGARVADFLLLADNDKKTFVDADAGKVELRAVALAWAEKQTPGDLAVLYFVVGVGSKAPDWVKNDDLLKKTVLPQREAEGRLRKALSRFTEGAQIKKGKEKDDTVAFLNTAVIDAKKVFDDSRSMSQVTDSANQNANTGAKVPDTTGGSGAGGGLAASQQYGMQELYIDGAEVMDIAGAKDEHSRRISMKIYTRRDPGTGELINEIGIFDITDAPDNIFGQRFASGGGDQSFILDDRTPGHKKYELKFKTLPGGVRQVTFGRPGDGGSKIVTSVASLYNKRADQVADLKNVVNVGGQEFYVAPQGGAMGALAMYPKSLIDSRGRDGVDARTMIPGLYSEVSKRNSEGLNQNVPPGELGGPHLGSVGGKPYRLEFNSALGYWEVKEGAGNLPPKPKPAGAAGSNGGTGNSGGGDEASSGGKPIAELERLLLELPECRKNPADTAKLSPELAKTFGLVTCNKTNKPEDLQVFVLVPASVRTEQQLMYPGEKQNPPSILLRGRFLGHYLVLQFEKQVHYLDLKKPNPKGFEVVGYISDGTMTTDAKTGFKDMIPFMDGLTNHMGVTGEDTKAFAEVPDRMKKIGAFTYIKAGYRQDGARKQLVVDGTANGGRFEVWPEFKPSEGSSANASPASQYANVNGPANAMDGIVGSVDAPLLNEIALDKGMTGKAIKKQADIVVYEAHDPNNKLKPNQYFVMFRYDALDPKDPAKPEGEKVRRTFRQKPFEVFNSSKPIPSNFEAQGLVGVTVIRDRVAAGYRFIDGSNTERGVMAVFQEKQVSGDNVKDKPGNCVGPILWWGLNDREAALKVCQEDKF